MPRVPADYIPVYRLHKQSGQAVVTLNYRDYLLGALGSSESKAAYHELIGRWLKNDRKPLDAPPRDERPIFGPLTVATLCDAFQRHADAYYAAPGKRTNAAAVFKLVLRDVRERCATLRAVIEQVTLTNAGITRRQKNPPGGERFAPGRVDWHSVRQDRIKPGVDAGPAAMRHRSRRPRSVRER